MAKFDIYQEVTNRIIEQLEQGNIPWHKPWGCILSNGGAYNRVTKKPYSLLNQMLLMHDGEYASFKQWSNMGGKIKKGEHPEMVVFWKIMNKEEEQDGKTVRKTIPMLRYYNVFHISQVDGVEPKEMEVTEHEPIKEAEDIISAYDNREPIKMVDVIGDKAYYSPSRDYLQVPVKEQYRDIAEYYSTKFHEMVHSTGHKSRLGRFDGSAAIAPFGSEDYSKEELVAEIGSACLMNAVGIETPKTFKNSAAYIQSWLRVLKDDKRMIVSAGGKAQKAVEYILGNENKACNE